MNSERQTRQEKIDLQLGRAGWAVGSRRLVEEFLVDKASPVGDPKSTYPSNNEFADYALLDRFDRPFVPLLRPGVSAGIRLKGNARQPTMPMRYGPNMALILSYSQRR